MPINVKSRDDLRGQRRPAERGYRLGGGFRRNAGAIMARRLIALARLHETKAQFAQRAIIDFEYVARPGCHWTREGASQNQVPGFQAIAQGRKLVGQPGDSYRGVPLNPGRQPGFFHPPVLPQDPRTARLFAVASEEGLAGRYVALMSAIGAHAQAAYGKPLPVNATGAIGALCCELGISWKAARGIAVIGRAVGLVGHLVEEQGNPIAREIWQRTEAETSRQDDTAVGSGC